MLLKSEMEDTVNAPKINKNVTKNFNNSDVSSIVQYSTVYMILAD